MMRRVPWRAALLFIAVLCTAAGAYAQSGDEVVLMVSPPATVLHTGDAVLITVEASSPLTALEGEAFGRAASFWAAAGERQWFGLIGIDVDARPGTYDLVVHGTSERGAAHARVSLPVQERRVETRRIRVAERFMNPPQEEAARIAADAQRLAQVFAQSQSARLWHGPFTPPVPGSSTSGFGRLTVMNNVPRGRHRGVDFRAQEGTPVYAPNAGVVVLASDLYFTGNTVILDHGDGLLSLLAHLSYVAVEEGMHVAGGDLVGKAGATGRVTGPHLHWAVRVRDATVDPLSLISALRDVN
jgi:murein DD-endopeptidase MepM/ murein hydrolase activator NlpD